MSYRYIGPADLAEIHVAPPARALIQSPADVLRWCRDTGQKLDAANSIVLTYVVDIDAKLWIADRHSEHVQCARGGDVRAAGELTFNLVNRKPAVVAATNQSTGYCPEPDTWTMLDACLAAAGFEYPTHFTTAYHFRRCEECGLLNVIKEDCWECCSCGQALPVKWNCDRTR